MNSTDFNAATPIGTTSNWDGSTKTYAGWASSFSGCSTVVSSSLTITLVGTNEVEVTIEIVVDGCSGSEIYSDCGPGFGLSSPRRAGRVHAIAGAAPRRLHCLDLAHLATKTAPVKMKGTTSRS